MCLCGDGVGGEGERKKMHIFTCFLALLTQRRPRSNDIPEEMTILGDQILFLNHSPLKENRGPWRNG